MRSASRPSPSPSNSTAASTTGSAQTDRATATIADDDAPMVMLGATDGSRGRAQTTQPRSASPPGQRQRQSHRALLRHRNRQLRIRLPIAARNARHGATTTRSLTILPIDDGHPEDLETITITLEADPSYTSVSRMPPRHDQSDRMTSRAWSASGRDKAMMDREDDGLALGYYLRAQRRQQRAADRPLQHGRNRDQWARLPVTTRRRDHPRRREICTLHRARSRSTMHCRRAPKRSPSA